MRWQRGTTKIADKFGWVRTRFDSRTLQTTCTPIGLISYRLRHRVFPPNSRCEWHNVLDGDNLSTNALKEGWDAYLQLTVMIARINKSLDSTTLDDFCFSVSCLLRNTEYCLHVPNVTVFRLESDCTHSAPKQRYSRRTPSHFMWISALHVQLQWGIL